MLQMGFQDLNVTTVPQLSDIRLTIAFIDPMLEADEKDAEVARLLIQMRELAEVKTVCLVADEQATPSKRILSQFVVGTLTAEIERAQIWKVFGFLRDRLSGKSITLKLGVQDKTIAVQAQSAVEMEVALKACEEFLINLDGFHESN